MAYKSKTLFKIDRGSAKVNVDVSWMSPFGIRFLFPYYIRDSESERFLTSKVSEHTIR